MDGCMKDEMSKKGVTTAITTDRRELKINICGGDPT